jgi:hypothetical protein
MLNFKVGGVELRFSLPCLTISSITDFTDHLDYCGFVFARGTATLPQEARFTVF